MSRPALAPSQWWRALEGRRIDDLIPQAPPGLLRSLALALGSTSAAGLLRWAIDPLVGGDMALVTFLVPTAVVTFVLGYRWGALTAALGGGVGLFLFTFLRDLTPTAFDLWALGVYAIVATSIIAILGLARSALQSARAEKARAEAASERLQMVSQELSHRIQNIFAVISGIISLSVREHPVARSYADDLLARIQALGAAHEFVRPHSPHSRQDAGPTTLTRLLRTLFEAYREDGAERIVLSGVDLPLQSTAATPVALLFHELATNSLKYGALSRPDGQVTLEAEDVGDDIQIVWTETGGPPVREIPEHSGFGSRLITMSVEKQLHGVIRQNWAPPGLRVTVTIPRIKLTG